MPILVKDLAQVECPASTAGVTIVYQQVGGSLGFEKDSTGQQFCERLLNNGWHLRDESGFHQLAETEKSWRACWSGAPMTVRQPSSVLQKHFDALDEYLAKGKLAKMRRDRGLNVQKLTEPRLMMSLNPETRFTDLKLLGTLVAESALVLTWHFSDLGLHALAYGVSYDGVLAMVSPICQEMHLPLKQLSDKEDLPSW